MPVYVGSQFRPLSYDEWMKPVALAEQKHDVIEEEEGQLKTLASVWENKLSQEKDPTARKQYMGYINDLKSAADSLYQQGLTPSSKQDLINMKARYATDIVPIEQAYKTRQDRVEEQRQMRMKDPTSLFERDLGEASVDEFMSNPNLSASNYSGALLTKQVGDAAGAMAKEMRDNPRKWRNILGNQYYETMMKRGFSGEQILRAIEENPNAPKELTSLVDNVLQTSGVNNWNNDIELNRAKEYAKQGLYQSIGQTDYQVLQNEMALIKAREQSQKAQATEPPPFTPINKTKVNPKIKDLKLDKLAEDLKIIEEMSQQPDKYASTYYKQDTPKQIQFSNAITKFGKGNSGTSTPDFYKEQVKQSAKQLNKVLNPINAKKDRINELYSEYGVNNINELYTKMKQKESLSASLVSDYQIELADNDLFKQKIKERISSRASSVNGDTGIWEITSTGLSRKTLDQQDINEMLSDKEKPATLVLDTDMDRWVLSYDGERYVIDENILDPTGKSGAYLKNQAILKNAISDDPYDVDAQSGYDTHAKAGANRMGNLVNSYRVTQSSSGNLDKQILLPQK